MRIPRLPQGQVQSLGRENIGAAVESAQLPYKAAQKTVESAYEAYDHYQLLQDQESALTEVNKSNAVNGVLRQLKDEQVNLDQLPVEAVEAYRNSANYDDTLHGITADGEFAPTHKIAQSVYDWANTELQGSNERLRSPRAQALYNEDIGEDINEAFESANIGVRGAQISSLRLQNDVAIDNANVNGRTDKALALAKNGLQAGVYSEAEYRKREADIFSFRANLYNEDQTSLRNDAYSAAFAGNPDLVANLMAQANQDAKIVGKYSGRIVSPDQQNEYTRQLNNSMFQGTVDGKGQRMMQTVGLAETLLWLEGQEQKFTRGDYSDIPQGVTPADAQKVYSKTRARVQERQNAKNRATEDVKGSLKKTVQLTGINEAIRLNGGVLPAHGQAYKDYSELYLETRNKLKAQGASQEAISQLSLAEMRRTGQMPKSLMTYFDSVDRQSPQNKLDAVREYAYYREMNPEIARQYKGHNVAYLNMGADMIMFDDFEANSEAMIDQLDNAFVKKPEDYDYNVQLARDAGELTPTKYQEMRDEVYENVFETGALFWKNSPELEPQIARAMDRMYTHERGKDADHKSAMASVEAQIASVVGVSKTNKFYEDGKVMLLPPEKVYGQWALAQADRLKAEQFSEYDPRGIYFETDGLTMTQENPSYKIMWKDPEHPDFPNNTGYQLTSWDKGGNERGVITGMSGARWRPNFTDTPEYREAQKIETEQLLDGQFIKEQQSVTYAAYMKRLNDSGITADSSDQEIQLALTDAYDIYDDALNSLKDNPRFYTEEKYTDGRGQVRNKSIFDRAEYKKAWLEIKKSQQAAKKKWLETVRPDNTVKLPSTKDERRQTRGKPTGKVNI